MVRPVSFDFFADPVFSPLGLAWNHTQPGRTFCGHRHFPGDAKVVNQKFPITNPHSAIRNQKFNGAPGASRTRDPLLRRQMLYPTELRAQPIHTTGAARCAQARLSGGGHGLDALQPCRLKMNSAQMKTTELRTLWKLVKDGKKKSLSGGEVSEFGFKLNSRTRNRRTAWRSMRTIAWPLQRGPWQTAPGGQ